MLAAGNYGVIEVRLNHDISRGGVYNLPRSAVCTKAEGFSYSERKLIFTVYIEHRAAFNICRKGSVIHFVSRAFRIFICAEGYGNAWCF